MISTSQCQILHRHIFSHCKMWCNVWHCGVPITFLLGAIITSGTPTVPYNKPLVRYEQFIFTVHKANISYVASIQIGYVGTGFEKLIVVTSLLENMATEHL